MFCDTPSGQEPSEVEGEMKREIRSVRSRLRDLMGAFAGPFAASVLFFSLAAVSLAPGRQESKFESPEIGLSFRHPSNWKVEKTRAEVRFVIPLAGVDTQAALGIFAASFLGETQTWLDSQRQMNENLRHETLRQWTEEILGVPLLLTKSRYQTGGRVEIALSGLLYARSPRKLLFRLSAPESAFEEAEFLWRKAMETLRTLDEKLPQPEDPGRAAETNSAKPASNPAKPPTITVLGSTRKSEPVKAPIGVPLKTAGRSMMLRIPEGWTSEPVGESGVNLKHASLSGDVSVRVFSLLDSDPAARALMKASNESLKLFDKVSRREDVLPKANRAGAKAGYVWRTGENAQGQLAVCDAAGESEGFYWLLRWTYRGAASTDLRKLVMDLIGQMSVEPAE